MVLFLVEVKGGDVLARLAIWHEEGYLPAEASRPGQGFVQDRGAVRGADEEDVVVRGFQRADAQNQPGSVGADHTREEKSVKRQVDETPQLPGDPARIVDAVHEDEQHVQSEL